MFYRVGIHSARRSLLSVCNARPFFYLKPSRKLVNLPNRGVIRPWYRRFWPLTITFTVASASIPVGYIIYKDFLENQLWFNDRQAPKENFDENSECVTQSELDELLSQTEQLLNAEIYSTRSSNFIVPIRLFFRTLKLIVVFTPLLIFYIFQDKFAPQYYEKWCFALKR